MHRSGRWHGTYVSDWPLDSVQSCNYTARSKRFTGGVQAQIMSSLTEMKHRRSMGARMNFFRRGGDKVGGQGGRCGIDAMYFIFCDFPEGAKWPGQVRPLLHLRTPMRRSWQALRCATIRIKLGSRIRVYVRLTVWTPRCCQPCNWTCCSLRSQVEIKQISSHSAKTANWHSNETGIRVRRFKI